MSKLFTLWEKLINKVNSKADLVDGKVPIEQLPEDIATKGDIESAVSVLDTALSEAIGNGVLE